VTFRKYLVLAGVTVLSPVGDALLNLGMKQVGTVSLHGLSSLILATMNPWVACGILFLIAYFSSYMAALSWADLTYVLPATSLGYVLVALIAWIGFHEAISPTRWLGIALITAGVGFVAAGPSLTPAHEQGKPAAREAVSQEVRP